MEAKNKLEKLLWININKDYFDRIVEMSGKFVKFHELWHSLFKWIEYDSDLEELKADLSFFLKTEDEILSWKNQDINAFIWDFLSDVIRIFGEIDIETWEYKKAMFRYIVSKAVELSVAIRAWFLKIENKKLIFNKDNFEFFIEWLVETLFEIKKIYENKDKDAEKEFLEKYDFRNKDIWEIVKIVNK